MLLMAALFRHRLVVGCQFGIRRLLHFKLRKCTECYLKFDTVISCLSLNQVRATCSFPSLRSTPPETVTNNSFNVREMESKWEVEKAAIFETIIWEIFHKENVPNQKTLQQWHERLQKYKLWPLQLLRMLAEEAPCVRKTAVCLMLLDYAVNTMNISGIALEVHQITTLLSLGSSAHSAEGFKLFKEFEKKYKVFDKLTGSALMTSLSRTEHWREAWKLMSKNTPTGTSNFQICVLQAAIRNKDWGITASVMELMNDPGTTENMRIIFSVSHPAKVGFLMLRAMDKKKWVVPTIEGILAVDQWFLSQSWNIKPTSISSRYVMCVSGVCHSCGEQLPKLVIKPDDFTALQKSFIDTALIGKDVFRSCHPLELKDFRKFLKTKTKPFDVVIDGLNVLYCGKRSRKDVGHVKAVVAYFAERGQTVLLMGRKHLHKQLKSIMPEIEAMASYFFISNLSKDDPFLLYAALESGINTRIVAMDTYRDFIFRMGPVLGKTLEDWLQTHRVQMQALESGGEFKFQWPPTYAVHVHRAGKRYHIPYRTEGDRPSVQFTQNWRCAQISH